MTAIAWFLLIALVALWMWLHRTIEQSPQPFDTGAAFERDL